jgi:hypothetical protein
MFRKRGTSSSHNSTGGHTESALEEVGDSPLEKCKAQVLLAHSLMLLLPGTADKGSGATTLPLLVNHLKEAGALHSWVVWLLEHPSVFDLAFQRLFAKVRALVVDLAFQRLFCEGESVLAFLWCATRQHAASMHSRGVFGHTYTTVLYVCLCYWRGGLSGLDLPWCTNPVAVFLPNTVTPQESHGGTWSLTHVLCCALSLSLCLCLWVGLFFLCVCTHTHTR